MGGWKWGGMAAAMLAMAGTGAQAAEPGACALVQSAAADALFSIPFRTVDGRIYIEARVDGQELDRLRLTGQQRAGLKVALLFAVITALAAAAKADLVLIIGCAAVAVAGSSSPASVAVPCALM